MGGADTALRHVARSLALDLATGEVVGALTRAGIESLLLRGPAVARLYPDGEARPYVDVDLLVAPGDERRAGAVLAALGFAQVVEDEELRGHRPLHAHEWLRSRDGAAVDLHRSLSGVGVPPCEVWRALSAGPEAITVGRVATRVPSAAATALAVALHAAHHGPGRAQSLRDLEVAVERLPLQTWQAAAALGARLAALPSLAAGLRLLPAGAELAGRLALAEAVPVAVALRASGAPPLALGLDWLLETQGSRAKVALLLRTLAPTPGALRSWRALARRRRYGLLAAYLSHPFWLARHAVPSVAAVVRARRSS